MRSLVEIKPLVSIKDESLETNLQGKLHLSIQRTNSSISWSLLHVNDNRYLALEAYNYSKSGEEAFIKTIKSFPWFSNVTSVSLGVVSDKITLVPQPLFDEKSKVQYGKFNFENHSERIIRSAKVRSAACVSVFAIEDKTEKLYLENFPGIKIVHAAMPFIEAVLTKDKNENIEKAYLNIRSESIELAVTKNGSLLYYNTFSYATSEDVIYYLLFAFEQLKINPEIIALQLMGEVERNDSVFSIIHKYVRNVSFIGRNTHFNYSYRFNAIPEHAFYSLFSQYLCV